MLAASQRLRGRTAPRSAKNDLGVVRCCDADQVIGVRRQCCREWDFVEVAEAHRAGPLLNPTRPHTGPGMSTSVRCTAAQPVGFILTGYRKFCGALGNFGDVRRDMARSSQPDTLSCPSCDDTEHPGLLGCRGVLVLTRKLCVGQTRQACALQRNCLPTGRSPLFRHLFLSFAPQSSPRCPFGSDAKRDEIGSGLDLFRLVFVERGAQSLPPLLGEWRHRPPHPDIPGIEISHPASRGAVVGLLTGLGPLSWGGVVRRCAPAALP